MPKWAGGAVLLKTRGQFSLPSQLHRTLRRGTAKGLTCVCSEGVEERRLGAWAPETHGAIAGTGQELHLGAVYGQPPHSVCVGHQCVR